MAWLPSGSLKGPQGIDGIQGPSGIQGLPGADGAAGTQGVPTSFKQMTACVYGIQLQMLE